MVFALTPTAPAHGGVLILDDRVICPDSSAAVDGLANTLRHGGRCIERTILGPDLTPTLWQDARDSAHAALARLVTATGTVPSAVGVGLGALLALDLALDGRVQSAVAWQPDLTIVRALGNGWRERDQRFHLADRTVSGDYGALQPLRRAVEGLRSRVLPVPALVISDVYAPRAIDPRWFADHRLRHEWLTVSTEGDVTRRAQESGWQVEDTAEATLRWLDRLPARLNAPQSDGRLVDPAPTPHQGRGSIFISYRHTPVATARAEHIRDFLLAAGFRAWLDHHSLGPDDIRSIVDAVISEDCSGGVLVLTDDIPSSTFIMQEELPRLLAHAERHDISIALDNTVRRTDRPDLIDPTAPLTLLGLDQGSLDNFVQYDLMCAKGDNYGMDAFLRGLLAPRMEELRNTEMHLDIQTYPNLPVDTPLNQSADLRVRAPLDMRATEAAHTQRLASLERFALALPIIGETLHAAGPERVIVTGGSHPPVALALGGMLSNKRVQCPVILENRNGQVWGLPDAEDHHRFTVADPEPRQLAAPDLGSGRVAVLVAGRQTTPQLFDTFLDGLLTPLAGACIVTFTGPNMFIDPDEGLRVAQEFVTAATKFADAHSAREILLCYTLNFELGVLMGRLFNKYRIVAYDLIDKQWYGRMLALSRNDSQIESVFADDPYVPRIPDTYL